MTQINPPVFDIDELIQKNKELIDLVEKNPDEKAGFEEFKRNLNRLEVANDINKNVVMDMLSLTYPDESTPEVNYSDGFPYIDSDLLRPNYASLRLMGRSEPAKMIKNWVRYELQKFCRPASRGLGQHTTDVPETGFRLTFEDRIPSTQERKFLDDMERRICGGFFFPFAHTRANMHGFMGQAYDDYFDIDDNSIEKARDLTGFPVGLHIRDPRMYAPIVPKDHKYPRWDVVPEDEYNKMLKSPFKVNLLSDKMIDDVGDPYEYLFHDRNKKRHAKLTRFQFEKIHFFTSSETRCAFRSSGGIMEQANNAVRAILSAFSFNATNMSNNHAPQGVIGLTGGTANMIQVEKFKKLLYAYTSGAANRHKIPVIGLPKDGDLKWVPFNYNSKDLEYHLWIVLLYTVLCRLAGVSPEMISISSHEASMSNNTLFKQDAEQIRQVSTSDGIKSWLYSFADRLNGMDLWNYIFPRGRVICQFLGMEAEVQQTKIDNGARRVALATSINTIRKENADPPAELIIGGRNIYDIPGYYNPAVQQALQTEMQIKSQENIAAQQQQQQNNGGGQPGADEEEMDPQDAAITKKYGSPVGQPQPSNN